jgi:DoxX-like protein
MQPTLQVVAVSKKSLWTGRVLSALTLLFLLFDAVTKFLKPLPVPVVTAFDHLGLPWSMAPVIGSILLLCLVLFVIPQTTVLGAVLLTGYLGGAVAINLRVGDPLFGHVLFPVYFGAVIWLSVYLREERLRALLPFRR